MRINFRAPSDKHEPNKANNNLISDFLGDWFAFMEIVCNCKRCGGLQDEALDLTVVEKETELWSNE